MLTTKSGGGVRLTTVIALASTLSFSPPGSLTLPPASVTTMKR